MGEEDTRLSSAMKRFSETMGLQEGWDLGEIMTRYVIKEQQELTQ